MKVIFLDIDGVLYPCFQRKKTAYEPELLRKICASRGLDVQQIPDWDLCAVYSGWDKGAMLRLKKLIEHHNAVIVIESSWRYTRSLEELQRLFGLWELQEAVVGITPLDAGFLKEPGIQEYLKNHRDIEAYVILDDIPMAETFGIHAIRCPDIFDEECYQKADRCLYGY